MIFLKCEQIFFNRYHSNVLFAGIDYDSKTLCHDSKIEYVEI